MKPEAVIFDIGNVLIEWNPERFYDARIGKARRAALFAEIDLVGMNLAIDAGALFKETIYGLADQHPQWGMEIRLWHDNWIDMASPRIEPSIALLRALRARGVPVFALTNFGIHSFAFAQSRYDFLTEFDQVYVSGQLGVIKPDPRIYEIVEARCGVAPGRLLFTDDRAENTAVARARGWQVHHFTGPQGWALALVGAGLLTTTEAGI